MAFPPVVLLAFCGVFCLAPVSFYLSWLATLNRRTKPTLIQGTSDVIGLVAGLSGFFAIGGLLIIGTVHSNARYAIRGNWEQIQAVWGQEQSAWLVTLGLYWLAVIGLVVWWWLSRQKTLVITSVDRWFLDRTIDELLVDLGKTPTRTGNLWSDGTALVEVNHFEMMCHSTIKLHTTDQRLAEEIERELRRRLMNAPEIENPAAVSLMWSTLTILLVMIGCLSLVLYYLYIVRR